MNNLFTFNKMVPYYKQDTLEYLARYSDNQLLLELLYKTDKYYLLRVLLKNMNTPGDIRRDIGYRFRKAGFL